MRTVYEREVANAAKIERTLVQGTARLCSPIFGNVCKTIWPGKTAEKLAAIVGCGVRTIDYELTGERDPSAQSLQAVINAITPKYTKR